MNAGDKQLAPSAWAVVSSAEAGAAPGAVAGAGLHHHAFEIILDNNIRSDTMLLFINKEHTSIL